MCSSSNLTRLALTICPTLQKLWSNVVLLIGIKRYFWVAYATIGYVGDAWAQQLREHVLEKEFIRSQWKSFTSHSIFSILILDNGLPLVLWSKYLSHTRSRSTKRLWCNGGGPPQLGPAVGSNVQRETVAMVGPITPKAECNITNRKQHIKYSVEVPRIHIHSKTGKWNVINNNPRLGEQ